MDRQKYEKLLQSIIDIGEEMIVSGAEINRVFDSIIRMLKSYGLNGERINVFIIISNLQVTMETPEGEIITQIRQILRNDVNFDRLDYLNDLSRYICKYQPGIDEIRRRFNRIMHRKEQPLWIHYLSYGLIAGGLCGFFGGMPLDIGAASVMGLILCWFSRYMADRERNQIVLKFELSLLSGILAILMVRLGFGHNMDVIMMGGIMLLIPGIDLTNSVRDVLIGDTASGLLRLFNALLVAGAIASGFAVAMILLKGVMV